MGNKLIKRKKAGRKGKREGGKEERKKSLSTSNRKVLLNLKS